MKNTKRIYDIDELIEKEFSVSTTNKNDQISNEELKDYFISSNNDDEKGDEKKDNN